MRLRDLERLLALLSGYSAGEIDQRMRFIRENGTVPSGPRGRNAPHVEPIHLAFGLLSMVARRATDAGEIAMQVAELRAVVPAADARPEVRTNLAVLLATAISYYPKSLLRSVDIAVDGRMAWVEFADGDRVLYVGDAELRDRILSLGTYEATGRTYMGHWLSITSATIGAIAAAVENAEGEAQYAAQPA